MKNKERNKLQLKLNKKTIRSLLSVICGLLVIAGICVGLHLYKKNKADRTVRVAFYGLSEEMMTLIKETMPQEENIILEYDVISPDAFDSSVVKQKYDMLFTWRREITDTLSPSAEDIPVKVLENLPNSLRNK